MITTSDAELLDREQELDTLGALLAEARDGWGGIVLIEGPAGQGKTTLLRAARAQAEREGLPVLCAVGAELERDFAYGVVQQLFSAGPDFADGACPPLAIIVDDAHWADAGSVQALTVLARRIAGLPIALIIASRTSWDDLPEAIVLRPQPLSRGAIAQLVAGVVDGEPDPAFVAAAAEITRGNPLLVSELRRMLAAEAYTGSEVRRLRAAMPGSLAGLVQGRLWRLGPAAVALARAVAALGDRVTPELAYALAGLDASVAAHAHASLAAVGLLEPDAPCFTHAEMREATLAGLVPATRSSFHRRAALLLHEAGASEEEIAAQVLAAEPGEDPRAARLLLCTGRRALALGDREVALRHLRGALRESGATPDPELLLALGLAEGGAGGRTWLTRAAQVGSPEVAARAEQALRAHDAHARTWMVRNSGSLAPCRRAPTAFNERRYSITSSVIRSPGSRTGMPGG